MQRFENRHWGLSRHIDPNFGEPSTASTTAHIQDPKEGRVDIVLDCSPGKRVSHYGLDGRATNMLSATSQNFGSRPGLVAKFFWSEESRISEPEILKRVYEIAEREPDVRNHVPVMVFSHVFSDSSTAIIRERLGLQKVGARVLIMILFEQLMAITKLSGVPFLECWWHTVKCHLALWKNGVYHRDISASNPMHKDQAGNVVGVLNDFDLATIAPGPTGNERTGTLPFMAQELLLKEGQEGKIRHTYAHDAESFVWVLTWICLRYDDGVLRKKRRPLDAWLKGGAEHCRKEKGDFLLYHTRYDFAPGKGHEDNWLVAQKGLATLRLASAEPTSCTHSDETCDEPFQKLLQPLREKGIVHCG